MGTTEQYIEALEEELATYEARGMSDRAGAVREQLKHYRKQEPSDSVAEPLGPAEQKRLIADQLLAEQRAAEQDPAVAASARRAAADDAAEPRPGLNGTTEQWRKWAADNDLGTSEDAGRDAIVAAYIDKYAPSGSASREDWVQYAKDHGVDPGEKTRDEIRAAVADAGWAPVAAAAAGQRNTDESKPRQTRGK